MATRFIYLVRHGQYQHDYTKDRRGAGLSELGHEQARQTGLALQRYPIQVVHSSSMRRALQTARGIMPALPGARLHRTRHLWETIPHVPFERQRDFPSEAIARNKIKADKAFKRFFKSSRQEDKHHLLVTHGNLIRYFVCLSLEVPLDMWMNFGSLNCGITIIEIRSNGQHILHCYNDTEHLEPAMQTDNFYPTI